MSARAEPSEIIRCLLHDGFNLESGARYCRTIALSARYSAYAPAGDADAYTEAAERLEASAWQEKLALDHVEDLENTVTHLTERVLELERTIVELIHEKNHQNQPSLRPEDGQANQPAQEGPCDLPHR